MSVLLRKFSSIVYVTIANMHFDLTGVIKQFRLTKSDNVITIASSTETLDGPGLETPRCQENSQSEEVVTLKNAQKADDGSSSSPFELIPSKSKNEDSAQSIKPEKAMSDQIVETSLRSITGKFTMPQQEKQAEAVVHSTQEETSKSPFNATLSVPMQSTGECHVKEDVGETKLDSTGFDNERSDEKCQSGKLKEMCRMSNSWN